MVFTEKHICQQITLLKNNPTSTEPYLIMCKDRNSHFAGLTYTQQINNLKEAYKLDSTNIEAIYSHENKRERYVLMK